MKHFAPIALLLATISPVCQAQTICPSGQPRAHNIYELVVTALRDQNISPRDRFCFNELFAPDYLPELCASGHINCLEIVRENIIPFYASAQLSRITHRGRRVGMSRAHHRYYSVYLADSEGLERAVIETRCTWGLSGHGCRVMNIRALEAL